MRNSFYVCINGALYSHDVSSDDSSINIKRKSMAVKADMKFWKWNKNLPILKMRDAVGILTLIE